MISITELDLLNLDLDDSELSKNPGPHINAARAMHPWLAKCGFGYVVHDFGAMKDLLFMDDKFRTSNDAIVAFMDAKGTPWGNFMETMMLARSGPEHARIRNAVAHAFTPRRANAHRALMHDVVAELLDEWLPKGGFDFQLFAAEFPIRITCALIGAPLDEIPAVRKSLELQAISFNLDKSMTPLLHTAYQQLFDFADGLITRRQEADGPLGDQLLDSMITSNREGNITDQELRDVLIVLLAAGFDTTTNTLVLIMHQMMQHPDVWERCAQDFDYCVKAVDEAMRYGSPSNVYRTVGEDFVYRDVLLPKDTQLFFTLTHAGRDPKAFEEPDLYRPERSDKNRHMPFGRGMHICLGMHLARAELHEGMYLITQKMTKLRIAGEIVWRPFTGSWGIVSLPIEFEPRKMPAETVN